MRIDILGVMGLIYQAVPALVLFLTLGLFVACVLPGLLLGENMQQCFLDSAHKPDDLALRNGIKIILKSFGELSLPRLDSENSNSD